MRLTFIILGLITSILAVILAILPLYILSFIPAILAILFGLLGFFKSKKAHKPTHTTQLIFLLTIIAFAIATYQTVYSTTEVGDTERLELREESSLEDSINELEDIEIIDSDIAD
ncbi:FUSC family protein [Bizionia gelidisalsuginis]|uniref:FUSC family protein n=1 Tax=Bizionia gelidisalsuginis TaxID=291188 RepID=A0ABY3M947_9FLAO|nr:FUSC family protein [Bizionia gelidisalsuginis]TYC10771.1 FUSC family protein [Bizionia gelidisalsuginis]